MYVMRKNFYLTPGGGGWGCLGKTCILDIFNLLHIKAILTMNKSPYFPSSGSCLHLFNVWSCNLILKFFSKIIDFIVLVAKFQIGDGVSYYILDFFYSRMQLDYMHMYEIPLQVGVL